MLGCEKPQGSAQPLTYDETKKLFDWAYENYQSKTLISQGTEIQEVPIRLSTEANKLMLVAGSDLTATVPKDLTAADFEQSITVKEDLVAPVTKGDKLGTLSLSLNGVTYGSIDLVALNDVSMSEVLYYAYLLENFFSTPLFKLILLVIILLFILYITFYIIRARRKRQKRRQMMRSSTLAWSSTSVSSTETTIPGGKTMDERKGLSAKNILVIVIVLILFVGGFFVTSHLTGSVKLSTSEDLTAALQQAVMSEQAPEVYKTDLTDRCLAVLFDAGDQKTIWFCSSPIGCSPIAGAIWMPCRARTMSPSIIPGWEQKKNPKHWWSCSARVTTT